MMNTSQINRVSKPTSCCLRVVLLLVCLFVALPSVMCQEEEEKDWGVVNVSVCNLRNEPEYNAGMATQALLGMPVKVLGQDDWLHVELPDGYQAWVHPLSVYRMSRRQLEAWNQRRQVVVGVLNDYVYSLPDVRSQHVGDVVASCRLALLGSSRGFWHVAYPDGRKGYLRKASATELNLFRQKASHSASAILSTARSFMGLPYMWGGTSTKGVDCSGFVSAVMLMHDLVIVRNASQQATVGEHIEIAPDFSNLQPGDLLFFGSKARGTTPARVFHVGFYMGGGRFIHSLGCVREGSFLPEDPLYDEEELHRLLWAQRVLHVVNRSQGLRTTAATPFYKSSLPK